MFNTWIETTEFWFKMNTLYIRMFDIISVYRACDAVKFGSLRSMPTEYRQAANYEHGCMLAHSIESLRNTFQYPSPQGCTNPGHQVTEATKFFSVDLNVCWFSVWNLLHVTLLATRILRWLLDFWKICVPLLCTHNYVFVDQGSPNFTVLSVYLNCVLSVQCISVIN
jgi:hypothetical protein